MEFLKVTPAQEGNYRGGPARARRGGHVEEGSRRGGIPTRRGVSPDEEGSRRGEIPMRWARREVRPEEEFHDKIGSCFGLSTKRAGIDHGKSVDKATLNEQYIVFLVLQ